MRWIVERIHSINELTDSNFIKLDYGAVHTVFDGDVHAQFRYALNKLQSSGYIALKKPPYDEIPKPKREHPTLLQMLGDEAIEDPEYFDPYFHIEVLPSFNKFYESNLSPERKLTPQSYKANTATLFINGKQIAIVSQKNRLGNPRNEPMQARAMRLLFNDVNSLKNGVPLRKIVNSKGVINNELKPFQRKQAKNHIAAINQKLKEVTDGRSLIKITKLIFYIDPELLENG